MKITPQFLRNVTLAAHAHPNLRTHVSACSGLIEMAGQWFAVSDDEHHLASFDLDPQSPAQLIRLFEGELPIDPAKRKSQKPDLEVLTALPASEHHPHGALLALGSGSKRSVRERGVWITREENGTLGSPQHIDLAPLYAPLRNHFSDLNIEGAIFAGDTFRLLQRGNASDTLTASISYSAQEILNWLAGNTNALPSISHIAPIDLGHVEGVPLTITDAAPVAGHAGLWAVSAAAENTANSYADGPCVGSAVAFLNANNEVVAKHLLFGAPKVEGIVATRSTTGPSFITVTMVTDADDPLRASQVLRAQVALPGYI
jgi:hypothetical protein